MFDAPSTAESRHMFGVFSWHCSVGELEKESYSNKLKCQLVHWSRLFLWTLTCFCQWSWMLLYSCLFYLAHIL